MSRAPSRVVAVARRWLWAFLGLPWTDTWVGLDRSLERGGPLRRWRNLAALAGGLVAGWWIYVPVHELLHALGCLAAGGTVSRLEIDVWYGGALLARVIPFVVAGSEYAGRLSGFDTGGSDLVYLTTDLAPYVLTLWPGVWALRRAGEGGCAFAFAFALPFALAPFLSLTGDAYEIGSIVATNLPPWSDPATAAALRSDDLVRLISEESGGGSWGGLAAGAALGLGWAFATYAAGAVLARGINSIRRKRPADAAPGRPRE